MQLPRISVGVFIILIALFVYGTSLAVWIVTIQAGEASVLAVADQYRFEYSRTTAAQLTVHLSTAENITASNARAFRNGVYVIPDRPDPRGPEVESFLVGFRSTLYGMMHVTTVSMTDYRGNLFGVYNNYNYTIAGMWQQYADPTTGEPVLLDFQTFPKDSPKEGQIMQSIGVTVPYNSSEQVWYTVCNTSIPDDSAWTPMYFMGNVGTVTSMVSQSHVAHRADGSLIGVMSIDMATGFVGATLSTIVDKHVFSFAVDANAAALLGTSAGDEIMACTVDMPPSTCPVENQIFLDPTNSTNSLVRDATNEILRRSMGSWLNAGSLDFSFGTKMVNTIRVSRRKLDWIVVVIIDRDAFLGDVQRTTTNMIIIEVVAGVAQIVLCVAFAMAIRQPLKRLIEQMEPLQRLDTDVEVDNDPSVIAEVAQLQQGHRALHFALERIKSFVPAAVYHELRRNGRGRNDYDDDADLEEDIIAVVANKTPSDGRSPRSVFSHRKKGGALDSHSDRSLQSTTASTSTSSSIHNTFLSTKASNRAVTMLAVNGVGFHPAIESMSPDVFADEMSRIVSLVNRVTNHFKGVLDFFQGDHFVVSFNAVKRVELHMRRALQAAVELVEASSADSGRRDSISVGLRCGVSSSRCFVGNLGTSDVKRFTIAGKAYTEAFLLERMCANYHGVFALTTQRCLEDCKGVVAGQLVDVVSLPRRPRVVIGCPREMHASDRIAPTHNDHRSRNSSVSKGGGGGPADDTEWMYTMTTEDEYTPHNDRFKAFLRGSGEGPIHTPTIPSLAEPVPTPEKLLERLLELRVDGTTYSRPPGHHGPF